jgi:hypothetical protein
VPSDGQGAKAPSSLFFSSLFFCLLSSVFSSLFSVDASLLLGSPAWCWLVLVFYVQQFFVLCFVSK